MSECEGEHPFSGVGGGGVVRVHGGRGGRERRKLGTAGLSPQEEDGTEGFGSKGGRRAGC